MMRAGTARPGESAKHLRMLEVLGQFRILFKSVRRHYGEVQRRAGIGGAQLWALSHIAGRPGINPGELARSLAIHPSTASNLLKDLEKLALVTKRRQKNDQRAVQLFATSKGSRVLRRAPRPLIGVLQQALSDLPSGNLDVLQRHLEKLVALMKAKDTRARAVPLSKL
jgi:MarR family transcriptional regulator, organic hydroperoxide resistance regulator